MTLTHSGKEIAEYFALSAEGGEPRELDGSLLRARYNLAPSQAVLAILFDEAIGRVADWRRWGLVPAWAKDPALGNKLFNARSETVETKPSFREAFRRRRCLVAANGFYEWTPRKRGHQPHHFSAAHGLPLALAGLYEHWQGPDGETIDSCTLLTTEASADVRPVHDRMPVILQPAAFDLWLRPGTGLQELKSLLRPAAAGTLESRAVSRAVNDPRWDDPRCLEPDPQAEQAALFELKG